MLHRQHRIVSVVFALGVGLLAGCAFGTRTANLSAPTPATPQSRAAASPAVPAARGKVSLLPFTDRRDNTQTIGEVRNGWGMHTADVKSDRDIAAWINQSAKTALERDGFDVLAADTADLDDRWPRISGKILTVYCRALFTYEAEISFFARIAQGGRELVNKRYTGTGSAGVNWAATGAGYAASLEAALGDALAQLIADLKTAPR